MIENLKMEENSRKSGRNRDVLGLLQCDHESRNSVWKRVEEKMERRCKMAVEREVSEQKSREGEGIVLDFDNLLWEFRDAETTEIKKSTRCSYHFFLFTILFLREEDGNYKGRFSRKLLIKIRKFGLLNTLIGWSFEYAGGATNWKMDI